MNSIRNINTDITTDANMDDTEIKKIHDALTNVLSDEKFLASPQMSAFLSYVVNETMAGNADRIKAYTVAVDALGKPTSFDPQNDPSVRVLANRLRASLDTYYSNNPAQALYIELYRGSYVPHFIDASGHEHIQGVIKNKPAANSSIQERYGHTESPQLNSDNVNSRSATRPDQQRSTDSINRVNSWLIGGSKKYG